MVRRRLGQLITTPRRSDSLDPDPSAQRHRGPRQRRRVPIAQHCLAWCVRPYTVQAKARPLAVPRPQAAGGLASSALWYP
jgi:hypothetical protein